MSTAEVAPDGRSDSQASGKTVARNAALNLGGSAITSVISLITVPIYFRLIGPERFGVLSIAWLLLGYFGLFDLGLGTATSFRIAALRDGTSAARARTFWTALAVNLGLGLVGGGALWIAGSLFFGHVFKVDAHLRPEMLAGVPLLASAVPIATLGGVLYGTLFGRERFFSTNVVSVVSTLLFQVLPILVVLVFGPYLPLLLASAVLSRLVALIVLATMCYFEIVRGNRLQVELREATTLLNYGAWITVAAIVGPILVFADRFAIGAVLGAVAVATYTVPFQLAQRINIIPAALTAALFPKLVPASEAEHARLSRDATLTVAAVITFPVLVAIVFLKLFLNIWVGPEVASRAAPVGQILLVGFWINAFAYIPLTKLQAAGRPRLVAQILVLQVLPYLLALYVGMTYLGLRGCAIVLCLRNLLDWTLLSWGARKNFKGWPVLLTNLVLLTAAVWLAGSPLVVGAQYAAFAILACSVLGIGWWSMPHESRSALLHGLQLTRSFVQRKTQVV